MKIEHIKASQFQPMPWKNGQGSTVQLAIHPANADFARGVFDWRLSIATIERDSDFSPLPGVDRVFGILEGEGLDLEFADGDTIRLTERGKMVRFAGERAVRAGLHAGVTRDLNLMLRRGVCTGEMWLRPLVGSMVLFVAAHETWLVYAHAGECSLLAGDARLTLAQGDLAQMSLAAQHERVVIEGGGELLLVKVATMNRSN